VSMNSQRNLPIAGILEALRSGVGDVPVMEEYGLSPRELTVIKREFLLMTPESVEPQRRLSDAINLPPYSERRTLMRREPLYKIRIAEKSDPRNSGIIRDIHTEGLRIVNLIVQTDEVKTLVIQSKPLCVHDTFKFEAVCRWSKINESGNCVAGFRITDISPSSLKELTKLIESLTVLPDDVISQTGRATPKKSISAKEALADISRGLDDPALMKKYNLAPDGLQSLFDKLINGCYITLAELQERMPDFVDTVDISKLAIEETKADSSIESRPDRSKRNSRQLVQDAAKDIKEGLDDFALMEKYRVSAKGLTSVFDKLLALDLITQDDIDGRSLAYQEHTVNLNENELDFGAELEYPGAD